MTFNSISFLLFFPLITALYYLCPPKHRWALLLTGSIFFYMALIPSYILIVALVILIDYGAAIWMEKRPLAKGRILTCSIVANLGLLFSFKYLGFFCDNLAKLARAGHWGAEIPHLELLLPLGLSFHTFQSLSYTIEVYRGRQRAERHLGIYALYVLFFPQAVAGPIERPQNLLPQFHRFFTFDEELAVRGLKWIAWGFFQKVVVADHLALLVNPVYSQPAEYSGTVSALATVFFAFQIYADFCGYSNIALGTAAVLGFRLSTNFRRPYLATSVADFWRRWHISLSTWFRDYLYIPLGGSSERWLRRAFNLMVVFMLSGLWHGARWSFVVWGALNGLYLVAYQFSAPLRRVWQKRTGSATLWLAISRTATFLLIGASWIFFRAQSVRQGLLILRRITTLSVDGAGIGQAFAASDLQIGCLGILLIMAVDVTAEWGLAEAGTSASRARSWIQWAAYAAAVLAVINLGTPQDVPFIYFRF